MRTKDRPGCCSPCCRSTWWLLQAPIFLDSIGRISWKINMWVWGWVKTLVPCREPQVIAGLKWMFITLKMYLDRYWPIPMWINISYPYAPWCWNMHTYIYPTTGPNVGKYIIHGASGISCKYTTYTYTYLYIYTRYIMIFIYMLYAFVHMFFKGRYIMVPMTYDYICKYTMLQRIQRFPKGLLCSSSLGPEPL